MLESTYFGRIWDPATFKDTGIYPEANEKASKEQAVSVSTPRLWGARKEKGSLDLASQDSGSDLGS